MPDQNQLWKPVVEAIVNQGEKNEIHVQNHTQNRNCKVLMGSGKLSLQA